jgi:hypothetical protein
MNKIFYTSLLSLSLIGCGETDDSNKETNTSVKSPIVQQESKKDSNTDSNPLTDSQAPDNLKEESQEPIEEPQAIASLSDEHEDKEDKNSEIAFEVSDKSLTLNRTFDSREDIDAFKFTFANSGLYGIDVLVHTKGQGVTGSSIFATDEESYHQEQLYLQGSRLSLELKALQPSPFAASYTIEIKKLQLDAKTSKANYEVEQFAFDNLHYRNGQYVTQNDYSGRYLTFSLGETFEIHNEVTLSNSILNFHTLNN